MDRIGMLLLAVLTLALAACNTLEGMGKDIRKAGEAIERAIK